MKRYFLNRILVILAVVLFTLLFLTVKSNAASLSISTSKSSVSPGESYTVTVTLSNGAGYVSSGGQTQWLDNSSFSYTKTAGSSGSDTITASGTAADYTTEQDEAVSASKTVQIVSNTSSQGSSGGGSSASGNSGKASSGGSSSGTTKKTTVIEKPKEVEKSSVNTLSEISIEGQTISPEFNVDVREYKVNVPYDVTSVNVTATPTDSKATAKVEGNEDLKEGENTVTITVTAENGNESKYLIRVTRAREPLSLKSIVVKYTNQEGKIIELSLNPTFDVAIFEYSLEDLEYWVNNLFVQAEANLQDATIEIQGIDNLVVGENTITITARIQSEEVVEEGQEPKEEVLVYTIKVNKLAEPTFIEKIKNKIKLIFGGITTWYNNNQEKIVVYSLAACIGALIILSIYIVVDYNKYKTLIEKLKKLEQINAKEPVEISIAESKAPSTSEEILEDNEVNKVKGGKHF